MLNISQVFSSTDMFGIWTTSMTYNFTGDYSLTFGMAILCLVLLMSLFKFPDMLMVVVLVAPLVLISSLEEVGSDFNVFVGILILYAALVIWSLFPGK